MHVLEEVIWFFSNPSWKFNIILLFYRISQFLLICGWESLKHLSHEFGYWIFTSERGNQGISLKSVYSKRKRTRKDAMKIRSFISTTQKTHSNIHPWSGQCWDSVVDDGPTLIQHCVDAMCLAGTGPWILVWLHIDQCCVITVGLETAHTSFWSRCFYSSRY